MNSSLDNLKCLIPVPFSVVGSSALPSLVRLAPIEILFSSAQPLAVTIRIIVLE